MRGKLCQLTLIMLTFVKFIKRFLDIYIIIFRLVAGMQSNFVVVVVCDTDKCFMSTTTTTTI